jgi:hypothetical protein
VLALCHFDPETETMVETNAFSPITVSILLQYNNDGILQPVTYFSRKHSPVEINYEIYDKKLLAIVHALRKGILFWKAPYRSLKLSQITET